MKLKRLLAGLLAGTVALTSATFTGITASAAAVDKPDGASETVLATLTDVPKVFTSTANSDTWIQSYDGNLSTWMADKDVYLKFSFSDIDFENDDGFDFDTILSWGWSSYSGWLNIVKFYANSDGASFDCVLQPSSDSTSESATAYIPLSDLQLNQYNGLAGNYQLYSIGSVTVDSVEIIKVEKVAKTEQVILSTPTKDNPSIKIDDIDLTKVNENSELVIEYETGANGGGLSLATTFADGSDWSEISGTGAWASGKGQRRTFKISELGLSALSGRKLVIGMWNGDGVSDMNDTTINSVKFLYETAEGAFYTKSPDAYAITSADATVTVDNAEVTEAVEGATVVVAPTAKTGYKVTAVSVAGSSAVSVTEAADGTYSFKMPAEAVTVTVTYAEAFSVTVDSALTNATLTVSPEEACKGESVKIKVVDVADGYEIVAITATGATVTEGASADEYCFEMPAADTVVSATLKRNAFTVTAGKATGGTVSVDKTTAAENDTITVTAKADAGYVLDKITYTTATDGTPVTVSGTTFKMPADDVTVTATFVVATYNVTVDTAITGGTVTTDVKTAKMGDTVTITAVPEEGYVLGSVSVVGDSGAVKVTNNKFIMPAEDVEVSASFIAEDAEVYAIKVIDAENGTVTASLTEAAATVGVTVTATPDSGYVLDEIIVTTASGTAVTVTKGKFIMPEEDVTVTATFKKSVFKLTVKQPNGGAILTDEEDVAAGETVKLRQTPSYGYEFVNYTVNGVAIEGDSFIMPEEDVVVSAVYSEIEYAIELVTPSYAGDVSISKNVAKAYEMVTISIIPLPEWVVDTITVTDSKGKDVAVSVYDDNYAYFYMPYADVTVEVTFKSAETEQPTGGYDRIEEDFTKDTVVRQIAMLPDGKTNARFVKMVSETDIEGMGKVTFSLKDSNGKTATATSNNYYLGLSASGTTVSAPDGYVFLAYTVTNIPNGTTLTCTDVKLSAE